jgi:septal ring factor EnvC (AmiA/AmiB activator)
MDRHRASVVGRDRRRRAAGGVWGTPRERNRLTALAAALALVATAILSSGTPLDRTGNQAAAQGSAPDDAIRQRDEVRRRQGDVAAQIDTLRASDTEVSTALAVLTAAVAAQRDQLEDTRRALERAAEDVRTAERDEGAALSRLDGLNTQLREVALSSYLRPPNQADASVVLGGSPLDAPRRQALARFRLRDLDDLVDQVRARKDDVQRARRKAETARAEADTARLNETARLADLDSALAQQAGVAAAIEDRLDRALSEASSLANRDKALSSEIQRQQAELARQAAIARQQAQAAQAAAAAKSAHSVEPSVSAASRSSGQVRVVSVRGIEVSAEIAGQLAALLAQADADGITLDGSGYRSTAEQIEIRRQVCGTSDYAIWEMPSSSCSPPVARPGRSMHEKGLAIDFIVGGDLIRSRATPEYRWLAANAERYGLYNLPSEPWHWSTTGS